MVYKSAGWKNGNKKQRKMKYSRYCMMRFSQYSRTIRTNMGRVHDPLKFNMSVNSTRIGTIIQLRGNGDMEDPKIYLRTIQISNFQRSTQRTPGKYNTLQTSRQKDYSHIINGDLQYL